MMRAAAISFVSAVAMIASTRDGTAGITMVPCGDFVMPAPPLAHIAPVVHIAVKRWTTKPRHHVVHHGGRRGVMRSLHAVALAKRPMCPIWSGDETNGSLPDNIVHSGSGDLFSGSGGFGGDEGVGGFGGGGGGGEGGGGGSNIQPPFFIVEFTPPGPPVTPPPECCGTPTPIPTPTPVPEPSTWIMMALGFATVGFLRWRRA